MYIDTYRSCTRYCYTCNAVFVYELYLLTSRNRYLPMLTMLSFVTWP